MSTVQRYLKSLSMLGEAVIFRHSLFSLPFALSAILLESNGHPSLKKTLLIIIAVSAGRNAANALNRVIDADFDSLNPRTVSRHIPQRLLSKQSLLIFAAILGGILVLATALLSTVCLVLLPFAILLIGTYSFSKRFTWLCHYWLGFACSCSVMGSFIALSGYVSFRHIVLTVAHAFWVAGFDILYALPDIHFDRQEDLYSIPAEFGATPARIIAFLSHIVTILCLFAVPALWTVSRWYMLAALCSALLLIAEHCIACGNTERHIRIASYSINEILPLVIFGGVCLGVYV
ncbi:MAG: putative 4-hydroxybenzoate polyprenyltransferase [Treponema sp.]|jgi:4-hydroxybenzoate polyprenyltransferase|nr:putative 4-hydroxybenzoate polyprenyltransferase [Treponema sp.]